MKVTIAYIEEPPFGWTDANGTATGADLDLADAILRAIGVTRIEHRVTTFGELLPGVAAGRWDMNVPLFVTPERASLVAFSMPVWAIRDGFLVRTGNANALGSYAAIAKRRDTRLGIIAGQVQHESAKAAGVRDEQILIFDQQADAIDAVRSGAVDAYASTALGNRILADRIGAPLAAVDHRPEASEAEKLPIGAFSFNRNNRDLMDAVNEQLRIYLGSPDHRSRMAKFGLTPKELDPVLVR
jgi:polar amino acid transport system substrate-binding protein